MFLDGILISLLTIIAKYNLLVVKILQSMSGIDWFPENIKAFTRLQTNKVYFSDDEIDHEKLRDIVSRYNITLDSLTPINSGMVAIVFAGVNRDNQRVVIKTKRKNIYNRIKTSYDLVACIYNTLSYIAKPFRKLNDIFMNLKSFIESKDYILSQCDLATEIDALKTTRACVSQFDFIVIPQVYNEDADTDFIVMECLEGKPAFELTDQSDKIKYGEYMCRYVWISAYLTDYLHTDMHPGNVICMKDNKIGLIDFGMNIKVTPTFRDFVMSLFICIIEKEANPSKKVDILKAVGTMMEPQLQTDLRNYDGVNDIMIELMVNVYNGMFDETRFNCAIKQMQELTGIRVLRFNQTLVKMLMGLSMYQSTLNLMFDDKVLLQKVQKRTLVEAMTAY